MESPPREHQQYRELQMLSAKALDTVVKISKSINTSRTYIEIKYEELLRLSAHSKEVGMLSTWRKYPEIENIESRISRALVESIGSVESCRR